MLGGGIGREEEPLVGEGGGGQENNYDHAGRIQQPRRYEKGRLGIGLSLGGRGKTTIDRGGEKTN